jgi:hypothetical protein
MKIVLLFGLTVLGSLSVTRADPDGDMSNDHNTSFIRAHFDIVSSIRHLKADLGVLPSYDAKTALLVDFKSLQEYPDVEWWQVPGEDAYTKILADEKALDPSLKSKPVTRKKFQHDEKALDAAMQAWDDANA